MRIEIGIWTTIGSPVVVVSSVVTVGVISSEGSRKYFLLYPCFRQQGTNDPELEGYLCPLKQDYSPPYERMPTVIWLVGFTNKLISKPNIIKSREVRVVSAELVRVFQIKRRVGYSSLSASELHRSTRLESCTTRGIRRGIDRFPSTSRLWLRQHSCFSRVEATRFTASPATSGAYLQRGTLRVSAPKPSSSNNNELET